MLDKRSKFATMESMSIKYSVTRLLVIVLLAVICYGCTDSSAYRLPAVGQVIYCPACDSDLYLRVNGTSRTAYKCSDYRQAKMDIPVPDPGMEGICPLCHAYIFRVVEFDGSWTTMTHYRDAR